MCQFRITVLAYLKIKSFKPVVQYRYINRIYFIIDCLLRSFRKGIYIYIHEKDIHNGSKKLCEKKVIEKVIYFLSQK